jgi:hypothetical protein
MGKGIMLDSICWTLYEFRVCPTAFLIHYQALMHERRGRPEELPWQPRYIMAALKNHKTIKIENYARIKRGIVVLGFLENQWQVGTLHEDSADDTVPSSFY